MNKGTKLRIALMSLNVSTGGEGWNANRAGDIQEIHDMLPLLSVADLNRVLCVCYTLLDYPVEPEVNQHAQDVLRREMSQSMALLPEPAGAVTILKR